VKETTVSLAPLGKTFGGTFGFRASRGGFKYEFALSQSYTVAFTETEAEAETLADDVRSVAEWLKIDPDFVRTEGSVAYWPDENSDDYLDTIAACLS